jgi:hypothetical protein
MTYRLIFGAVFLLLLSAVFFLLVMPSQRQLLLQATKDLQLYDSADGSKQIGVLPMGKIAIIVRCDDNKSTINPVIELEDGRTAYVLTAGFTISSKQTGWFSRPHYLNCGDW